MIAVFRQELRLWFHGASGWVFGALFLSSTGLLFVSSLGAGEASLRPALGNLAAVALFTVPLLTLRQLAEEARSGTLEALLAAPIRPASLLLGKWLAAVAVLGGLLAWTAPIPLVLATWGDPDPAALGTAYLGWWAAAGTFAAVGLACSAGTRDPTAAGAAAVAVTLPTWLASVGRELAPERLAGLLDRVALAPHLRQAARGALDLGEAAWFGGITLFALWCAGQLLERRRLAFDGAERLVLGADALLSTALVGAFLAGAAELATRHPARWEIGADAGLDPDTEAVLAGLAGREVTVAAASARQLDPAAATRDRAIRDHLGQLAAWPGVTTRFVDLDREPAAARALGLDRHGTVVVSAGERRVSVPERALFSRRGPSEAPTITFVGEGSLTAAIRRVLDPERPSVRWTRGHGERQVYDRGAGELRALAALLGAQGIDGAPLDAGQPVPDDVDAVLVLAPQVPLPPADLAALEGLLARGGGLGWFVEPGGALPELVAGSGIRVGAGSASSARHAVGHPERPALAIAPHAVTEAVREVDAAVLVSDAAPLELGGAALPLLHTGPAGLLPGGEPGDRVVAAAVEGRGRLAVVGDVDLVGDALLEQGAGNGTFAVGLARWLVGAEVPPNPVGAGRALRTLALTSGELDAVRALLVVGVPGAWVLLGTLARWRRR